MSQAKYQTYAYFKRLVNTSYAVISNLLASQFIRYKAHLRCIGITCPLSIGSTEQGMYAFHRSSRMSEFSGFISQRVRHFAIRATQLCARISYDSVPHSIWKGGKMVRLLQKSVFQNQNLLHFGVKV